jgi:hypothetical protein
MLAEVYARHAGQMTRTCCLLLIYDVPSILLSPQSNRKQ